MNSDLCAVDNEAEAEALRQLLEDHDIEAHVVPLQSSAYPGAAYQPTWGVIRVEDGDLARARELVDEWRKAEPVTPREREPVRNESRERVGGVIGKAWPIARTVLLVGSLALNAHLIVKHVWHPEKNEVITTDAEGRPTARFLYEPWEAFPHQTDSFSPKGVVASSWFDQDADGWNELSQTFQDGQLAWEARDANEERTFEWTIGYVAGKKTVEVHDPNEDTRPDEVIGFRDGRANAWLRDRDADGFPEEVSCTDSTGATRLKNLTACDL